MNNDDVKKFINISNLYSEVEIEKTNKVDEGIIDWLEDKLGVTKDKAEAAVKEIPSKAKTDLDKVVNDNKLSKIDPLKLANPDGSASTSTDGAEVKPKTDAGNVEPRPEKNMFGGDIGQRKWDKKYGDTHNTDGVCRHISYPIFFD